MRSNSLFSPSPLLLKKSWKYNPGKMSRGGKSLVWRPKMGENMLRSFVFLDFEHPRRRPDSWTEFESRRLGLVAWPKAVGFFNKGDNFELTPEMAYRLFKKNQHEHFWTPEDNEQTVINLLPIVEKNPQENISKVEEIFASHVERFGTDHIIFNVVLQAIAFSQDFARCEEIFKEMKQQGLAPNGQTYVNMMLACRLADSSSSKGSVLKDEAAKKERASKYFNDAVRAGALEAVVRLDTEFQMWWDQLARFGTFSGTAENGNQGFLSVNEEGARGLPEDPFRIWGWDNRHERKFQTRDNEVRDSAKSQRKAGKQMGTVFNSLKREPWHRYKGLFSHDYSGPPKRPQESSRAPFEDAPPASRRSIGSKKQVESCGNAY